jgi:hypothetical protein
MWIIEDLNVRCYDIDHLFYLQYIAAPVLAWIGFCFPFICFLLLCKNRKNLNDPDIRIKYAYLFPGYRPSRFYWEFVIQYRKLLFAFVLVFVIQEKSSVQALWAEVILIISIAAQISYKPYSEYHLNKIETVSILTSLVTLYSGMIFLDGNLNV